MFVKVVRTVQYSSLATVRGSEKMRESDDGGGGGGGGDVLIQGRGGVQEEYQRHNLSRFFGVFPNGGAPHVPL